MMEEILTPKDRAMQRLSEMGVKFTGDEPLIDMMKALRTANRTAIDKMFAEDVEFEWTKKWKIKRIKGVSPLGKMFVMIHGGAKAFKGMDEATFEALEGKGDLCTCEILPPFNDVILHDADAARLHPYWKGLKINPVHGFTADGRPNWAYHLDPQYSHLPREEDVDRDVDIIVEDNIVVSYQATSQRGANAMAKFDRDLARPIIGGKYKGWFENWTWSWSHFRVRVTHL